MISQSWTGTAVPNSWRAPRGPYSSIVVWNNTPIAYTVRESPGIGQVFGIVAPYTVMSVQLPATHDLCLDGNGTAPTSISSLVVQVSKEAGASPFVGSLGPNGPVGGYLAVGQTAYNTGVGWWVEAGPPVKMSLGDPAGNNLTWDGSVLSITGAMSFGAGAGLIDATGIAVSFSDLSFSTSGSYRLLYAGQAAEGSIWRGRHVVVGGGLIDIQLTAQSAVSNAQLGLISSSPAGKWAYTFIRADGNGATGPKLAVYKDATSAYAELVGGPLNLDSGQYIGIGAASERIVFATATPTGTITILRAHFLVGPTTPGAYLRATIEHNGTGNLRLQGQTTNSRYRSDFSINGAAGLGINAFDDTGGVYLPIAIATTGLTVSQAFGCNGKAAQTAFASGGAAPAGGTGATAGAYDTAAHRDAAITLLNNIRTALVNVGIMS